jgi:hypothetical protein
VDDFALFGVSYDGTLKLKSVTFDLITGLGLKIHPTKGHFIPIIIGEHMGMIIDMMEGQFVAPLAKLKQIAVMVKTLFCRAATLKRWANVKTLASLAGKAQFLHLVIPFAKFFLREMHDVADMQNMRIWPPIVAMGKEGLGKSENGKWENKVWCKSGIRCHIMNILVNWSNTGGLARKCVKLCEIPYNGRLVLRN